MKNDLLLRGGEYRAVFLVLLLGLKYSFNAITSTFKTHDLKLWNLLQDHLLLHKENF